MISLRLRLFLALVLVGAVAIGTVAFFASRGTVLAVDQFIASDFERDRQRIEALLLSRSWEAGQPITQARVEELGQTFGVRVFLLDPEGRAVAASEPGWVGQAVPFPVQAGLPDYIVLNSEPVGVYITPPEAGLLAYPATPMAEVQFGPQSSAVQAPFAASVAPDPFRDSIQRSFLFAAGFALAAAGLLSWGLTRNLSEPVQALTEAARKMELGDLSQRVAVQSRDEIAQLAHAFNAMADGLSRAERLRRQLVTDVAHELRTPLTNLRGYLEAVKDGVVELKPDVAESLYAETMLLNRLVDDLQELALAEAGQLKLERQPADLRDLIARAVNAATHAATEKGLSLKMELPEALPLISLDAVRVEQVLRNLLHNALTHTPAGGTVTVSAALSNSRLTVSVSDTGEGLAPEHLPHVFERFYRADPARSRAGGGAGLGLAIVKQLVEAHSGRVWAESDGVGRGATFTFLLPM